MSPSESSPAEPGPGEVIKTFWIRSAQVTKTVDNTLGAIHGIGLTEYMVLDALIQAPNHALRRIDIAGEMARTASGVTRLLMPMEKIGLVKKQSNARDARVSMVKLTAAGAKVHADASVTLEEKARGVLARLTDRQVGELGGLLGRMQPGG
jgi:DNA-binding MarR family transcriptional regulator